MPKTHAEELTTLVELDRDNFACWATLRFKGLEVFQIQLDYLLSAGFDQH